MNLEHVIPQILAGTVLVGVSVACNCPPTSAPGFVGIEDNPAFADIVAEAIAVRERTSCDLACSEADLAYTDSWSCTFEGRLDAPSAVVCEPDEPTPGMQASYTLEIDDTGPEDDDAALYSPYPLHVEASDCQALCQSSESWAEADSVGVSESSIHCGPVRGASVDEVEMECLYGYECIGGRRPGAWASTHDAGNAVADWWAALAHLEHASIQAFEDLARTLEAHGAPASLVHRARQAADDERRHTVLACERAGAHGRSVHLSTGITPTVPPPLVVLARENALEGCVRETFAALEAHWQARTAADPEDRAVLKTIAADELRHGQLAWDLHAWLVERGVVDSAVLDEAFAELLVLASRPVGPIAGPLGIPPAGVRVGWVHALRDAA